MGSEIPQKRPRGIRLGAFVIHAPGCILARMRILCCVVLLAACDREPEAPAPDPKALYAAKQTVLEIQKGVEIAMVQRRGKCVRSMLELGATPQQAFDPWGTEYVIRCPGERLSVDVISAGPDKQLDTADDVANYTP